MSSPRSGASIQSSHRAIPSALHGGACFGAILRLAAALVNGARAEAAHRRQFRALGQLNDHLLRDIGLSREDVARACGRSFRDESEIASD